MLPLILADPKGMTDLAERMADDDKTLGDILAVLSFISLEQGASDLRSALWTLENHGPIALEAVAGMGWRVSPWSVCMARSWSAF